MKELVFYGGVSVFNFLHNCHSAHLWAVIRRACDIVDREELMEIYVLRVELPVHATGCRHCVAEVYALSALFYAGFESKQADFIKSVVNAQSRFFMLEGSSRSLHANARPFLTLVKAEFTKVSTQLPHPQQGYDLFAARRGIQANQLPLIYSSKA